MMAFIYQARQVSRVGQRYVTMQNQGAIDALACQVVCGRLDGAVEVFVLLEHQHLRAIDVHQGGNIRIPADHEDTFHCRAIPECRQHIFDHGLHQAIALYR